MPTSRRASTRTGKRRRRRVRRAAPPLPPRIYAQASARSIGGVSMFEGRERIDARTVGRFLSEADVTRSAVALLRQAGFDILQVTALTINIAGPARTYERAFKTKITAEERPTLKERGRRDAATFLDSPDTKMKGLISTRGTVFESVLEGVALEEPRYLFAPSVFAPLRPYWHLRLPGDLSVACNADRAHRDGITGRGVRVAMVDSGWFRHPYFVSRGYRAAPVVLGPATSDSDPLQDEVGHGTGESANIFAVAPDAELLPVKALLAGSQGTVLVNSTGAFNAAVALNPDIITCSWGFHIPSGPLSAAEQALAATVAAAVASGITVVFAAGNGHAGFPAQHPDVIAAGGVFLNPDETLQASNYASGFTSRIYSNRRVPDVCGLVGMRPKAIYLMLPLEPADLIDTANAGQTHPDGDETETDDGWAAFSGTSAAAPQVAGVAALIKQACPTLGPSALKEILAKTARDVTAGSCNTVPGIHTGLPAATGLDAATGAGLIDAHKATMLAKVRCLGPMPTAGAATPALSAGDVRMLEKLITSSDLDWEIC